MRPILHSIVVENFKTYAGKVVIGPLKTFMAVIGPNGSGKSNFLDAVSFALGEKVSKLRADQPLDLIHGSHIGKPAADKASVTVNFKLEDGSHSSFLRTVSKTSKKVTHYVNDQLVTHKQYVRELLELGINIKARNFVIYQGDVESIAIMDQKERLCHFEQMSGSISHKRNYEDLRSEMAQVENETQESYKNLRLLKQEVKDSKLESKHLEEYEALVKNKANKTVELYLFLLFHLEKDISELEEAISRFETHLEDREFQASVIQAQWESAENSCNVASQELTKISQSILDLDKLKSQAELDFISAKDSVMHIRKKKNSAELCLKKSEGVREKHLSTISDLEDKIKEASTKLSELQRVESQDPDSSIELGQSQVQEYYDGKRKVASLTSKEQNQLDTLMREQKDEQDRLLQVTSKLDHCAFLEKQKDKKIEAGEERIQKLCEKLLSVKEAIGELTARLNIEVDTCDVRKEMEDTRKKLAEINATLEDVDHSREVSDMSHKRKEVINRLKENFPGVFGRISNLCYPIHQKYAKALAKVMGGKMNNIVVDTWETAKLCIRFLKDNFMGRETFLALDFIQAKGLNESLRKLEGSHLLYDVVAFDPSAVRKAVLFVTKNALVCEKADDARKLAYETFPDRHLNVVAYDGTYFQKDGIISGGSTDLTSKSKHWDQKFVAQMNKQKESLEENLKKLCKRVCYKPSDFEAIRHEIREKERIVIPSINQCLAREKSEIATTCSEKDLLKKEQERYEPLVEELKESIRKRGQKIKDLEQKICKIEDRFFQKFCSKIGVANIRVYEKSGLRAYESQIQERAGLENMIDGIVNQLQYEKESDAESNVKRWTCEVERLQNLLSTAELAEGDCQRALKSLADELNQIKGLANLKNEEMEKLKSKSAMLNEDLKAQRGDIEKAKQKISDAQSRIDRLTFQRHSLLVNCKVEGISIPLLAGDLNVPDASQTSCSSSSQVLEEITSRCVIDFEGLSSSLKNLNRAQEVKECEDRLRNAIENISKDMQRVKQPNFKANADLEISCAKLKDLTSKFKELSKRSMEIKQEFEKIKKERYDSFMKCFEFVSSKIDTIYKQITKSTSAMACLVLENPEEPYLGGVIYHCIAPGKSVGAMDSLSGGEKTLASLALVLALQEFIASPLLILDEVDAALDSTNIRNIADYLSNQKQDLQTLSISLRPEFYGNVDGLIGVTTDGSELPGTQIFLMDLEPYSK